MTTVVDPAPPVASPRSRAASSVAWLALVVAIGLALRLPRYLGRPSLWIDEARLALSVAGRTWRGLLLPLDYDQTAPVVFLWLEKAAITIGGIGELALRAPVFIAGLLVIPLLHGVARRFVDARTALIAAAIGAVSPLLIQYSIEAKPYSVDLLASLALLHLGLDWSDRPASAEAAWRAAAVGVLAVWISTPAILVLVGIAAALWLAPVKARPPRSRLCAILALWGVSFAAAYSVVYRPAATNVYLQHYWADSLLTLWRPHLAWRAWQGVRDTVWWLFFGGSTEPPLTRTESLTIDVGACAVLLLAAAGVVSIARTNRARLWLLLSPMAAVIGASLIGLYPIAARLMVFAAPAIVIPVAAGAAFPALASRASRTGAYVKLLGLFLLVPSLHRDIVLALHPTMFEHVRPAVAELERRGQPGEPVYVGAATLPAWTFYTTNWATPDTERLARTARLASSGGPAFENAPPRGRPVVAATDSLVFPIGPRFEVLGRPNGAQWRSATGLVQYEPDVGWASAEAARIRAAARPTVWLLISHSYGLERRLYPELDRLGGQLEFAYGKDGVVLRRYRFP
jgi:Dolichyl-phosphate-mannose-protein mannosyltransferase